MFFVVLGTPGLNRVGHDSKTEGAKATESGSNKFLPRNYVGSKSFNLPIFVILAVLSGDPSSAFKILFNT